MKAVFSVVQQPLSHDWIARALLFEDEKHQALLDGDKTVTPDGERLLTGPSEIEVEGAYAFTVAFATRELALQRVRQMLTEGEGWASNVNRDDPFVFVAPLNDESEWSRLSQLPEE